MFDTSNTRDTFDMSNSSGRGKASPRKGIMHVTHADIADFAQRRVNLPSDKAKQYRAQANSLKEKLEKHVVDHPDYDLVKMRNAGSVEKRTSLRTTSDFDVMVYIKAGAVPADDSQLGAWTSERLVQAYPQLNPDQFVPQTHCVTIEFRGSGLSIDVVPVIYEGEPDDVGYLVAKTSGTRLKTSVTQHLQFLRARKNGDADLGITANPDLAQGIRLVKWWVKQQKQKDPDFRFKSFMVELILCRLSDNGVSFGDYATLLESFFEHLLTDRFATQIGFTDFYKASALPARGVDAIQVIDPVNTDNNVAVRYTAGDRDRILGAAQDAYDALSEARWATTKGRAVSCWQDVLGPSFGG